MHTMMIKTNTNSNSFRFIYLYLHYRTSLVYFERATVDVRLDRRLVED
jgi:hypothetical protein